MRRSYPALIHKDADSDYGISFPDFPGCVSAADTAEEAIVLGAESLTGHIAMMAQDNEAIPDPTPLAQVRWEDGLVCVTLVSVLLPSRARRINITLDESLIEEIDAISNNRSGFLADAARSELSRRRSAA